VAVQVAGDLGLEEVEAEEQLAQGPQLGRAAAAPAAGPAQLVGVEGAAAGVALVAAGVGGAAGRAGPLHVAVGQGAALAPAEGGRLGRLRHQPPPVQAGEQLLGDRVVPAGRGPGVVVEGDAGAGEAGRDALVLAVGQRRRRQPGPLGRDRDRGAVLVGPGDQQDPVAGQPVVAGGDVGGEVGAGQVAEVARPGRVRPGDADQDVHRDGPLAGDQPGGR
jgi:hypothetical protein